MTLLAFARQSAGGAHVEHSGERLLNWYAQPWPDGGTGALKIVPSPGLARHVALSVGQPVRAMLGTDSGLFVACGARLWRVQGGVATSLGAIADDFDTTIATNGVQVAVAAGGGYYVWNGTAMVTPTTGAFTSIGSVAALDSYIILAEKNGQRFSVTALLNAESIDALDFASAEGAPDHLVRVHRDHAEVWLFGTRSAEIWGNEGGGDFPFVRFQGGYVERGCAFPMTIASEDNGIFFVGNDRVVYRAAAGGAPQRVSTAIVEEVLRASGPNVSAFVFTLDGQKAYALRFDDRPAWVFDIASGMWHERNTGVEDGPWIATACARHNGVQYVGTTGGAVCTFGGVKDDGAAIMREAVSLGVSRGTQWLSLHEVEVQMRSGATDIGRIAMATLEHSADGRVWSLPRQRPLGALGEYGRILRWHGLGRARQHRVRLRVTDPVETAIYGAAYRAS